METKQNLPTEQEVRETAIEIYVTKYLNDKLLKIVMPVAFIVGVLFFIVYVTSSLANTSLYPRMIVYIMSFSAFLVGGSITIILGKVYFLSVVQYKKVRKTLLPEGIRVIVSCYIDEQINIANENIDYYREKYDKLQESLLISEEQKRHYETMRQSRNESIFANK